MPNLGNLKKKAKLYLRLHRDKHYPVAARIRAVLARFHNLTDHEVLAHSFKLSDAQELVARRLCRHDVAIEVGGDRAVVPATGGSDMAPPRLDAHALDPLLIPE